MTEPMFFTEDEQEDLAYYLGWQGRHILPDQFLRALVEPVSQRTYERVTGLLNLIDYLEAQVTQTVDSLEAVVLDDLRIDGYRKLAALRAQQAQAVDNISRLTGLPVKFNQFRAYSASTAIYY